VNNNEVASALVTILAKYETGSRASIENALKLGCAHAIRCIEIED